MVMDMAEEVDHLVDPSWSEPAVLGPGLGILFVCSGLLAGALGATAPVAPICVALLIGSLVVGFPSLVRRYYLSRPEVRSLQEAPPRYREPLASMLGSLASMETTLKRLPDGTTRHWAAPQIWALREGLWALLGTAIDANRLQRLHEAAERVGDLATLGQVNAKEAALVAALNAQAERFAQIRDDLAKIDARLVLSDADTAELLSPTHPEPVSMSDQEARRVEEQVAALQGALSELATELSDIPALPLADEASPA